MIELNKIYCMDNVQGMRMLDDGCVDLTVTSPPYDNLRKYNGYSFDFENVAKELYRVTKQGGVVVWVVGDATIKGSETGTSFRQALYFMACGFCLNDTMIWRKTNPMPQVKQPRYSQCFEYMFVFSKGTPKTFNPVMRKTKCGGHNYDSTCKNMGGENGRTEKHFVINKESVDYNIWDIAIAQNKTIHSAVFPEQLAINHIKSWSNEGDVVLDCFMGSGTTAVVAQQLGRNYIGFEISEEYVNLANKRLLETKSLFD